jgi:hypothetical protein
LARLALGLVSMNVDALIFLLWTALAVGLGVGIVAALIT